MLRAERLEAIYEELHANVFDDKGHISHPLLKRLPIDEQRVNRAVTFVKVNVERSPLQVLGLAVTFLMLCTMSFTTSFHHHDNNNARNTRHAMVEGQYSNLEVSYNFRMDEIEPQHWCLFKTDSQCPCEDPTHGDDRAEFKAWTDPHEKNVELLNAVTKAVKTNPIDVVFVGDETVQSWDGMWFNQRCPQNKEILGHWNRTFGHNAGTGGDNNIRALRLGISGDRIRHVLWRLQHGEMPTAALNAKVIWLVLGSRDLAVRLCSEEVVTLGIMRIAEEIKHYNPQATVVIQSILPRTHHPDGSLDSPSNRPLKHHGLTWDDERASGQNRLTSEYGELDEGLEALEEDEERQLHGAEPNYDYYLWPSIQNINREVQTFCETHDGFEFFDATPLFLTSKGNDRNHKFIQRELLREYAQLSHTGHGVLLDAIHKRLKQMIPNRG